MIKPETVSEYPEIFVTTKGDAASFCLVAPSGRKYGLFTVGGEDFSLEQSMEDFAALAIHINKGNAIHFVAGKLVASDVVYEKADQ